MQRSGQPIYEKTIGIEHTESIESARSRNSDSLHKHANKEESLSKRKVRTDEITAAVLTILPDSTVRENGTSTDFDRTFKHEPDEVGRPQGLMEVIGNLSPEHFPEYARKNDSRLSFPEKLMLLLLHVELVYSKQGKKLDDQSISWSENGKSFVIRGQDALCKAWVPMFFGKAKFSSFTRKLYRWGFRKVNVSINDKGAQVIVFSNEHFQRDDMPRICNMQSVTAAKIRNQLTVNSGLRTDTTLANASVMTTEDPAGESSGLNARLENQELLQNHQVRDQRQIGSRRLLASRINNPPSSTTTVENSLFLAQQPSTLDRYGHQPSVALPTFIRVGNSSTMDMSIAARSQLQTVRLLEALDHQRAADFGSDDAYQQLLLQRQLRAVQVPPFNLTGLSSLDVDTLIRRGIEGHIQGQALHQQGQTSDQLYRQYLSTLAAMLQRQHNR